MLHTKEIVTNAIKNASSVSVLYEGREPFEKVNEPLRDAIVKAVVETNCDFHLSQLDMAVEYEIKVLALDFPLEEGETAYTAEDTDTLDWVANTMIRDAFIIYIDTCELVNDTSTINLDAVAARSVSIMFGNHGKLNKSIIEDKERIEKEGFDASVQEKIKEAVRIRTARDKALSSVPTIVEETMSYGDQDSAEYAEYQRLDAQFKAIYVELPDDAHRLANIGRLVGDSVSIRG